MLLSNFSEDFSLNGGSFWLNLNSENLKDDFPEYDEKSDHKMLSKRKG